MKGEFRSRIYNKKKLVLFFFIVVLIFLLLCVRVGYVMIFQSEHYTGMAKKLHERERQIKAARGKLIDRNGVVIASNETVCTVSVIYSQMTDREKVIEVLSETLELEEETVRKKVEKFSSREKIKSNVPKETGDLIRSYDLDGVKVDEDYKRYYPFESLASKVLGFTGSDNQGIIGIEVEYEDYLKGTDGEIQTLTDARGVELDYVVEGRKEAIPGKNIMLSLDVNIQKYAEQAAQKVLEEKNANYVSIIVMNPQNGEIYAMVSIPEFNLNSPYTLNYETEEKKGTEEYQNLLNKMWRNPCINDTYEPGSTFKIVTATAGLEEGVVTLDSTFSCPGYRMVEDRRIKCHKTVGHGSETFVEATMNSCNPVFIDVGLRIGPERYFYYLEKLGLLEKTGVDLPGEAGTIIHKLENVGLVEMATMSFGQSFQITPLQLLRAASAVINGGTLITPHFAIGVCDDEGNLTETFEYETKEGAVSAQTSENMKYILTQVVSEGGGKNGQVEGYNIGGKTATSEKLPRGSGKYIGSYIGFAPADDPQVIAICMIDEPEGIYYGGTIAAPVISSLYENILPYLNIKKAEQ
ncbi:MAG: peptidoglycan glycosyltransferase [Lachnospiraceae bacterium]|nr:peptidoglycan glycosyltransferase [Lachnospiraceae bacterium]MCI8824327.1 peptidoglycan glycosyltransferase [Lachnospiraceae bacterium]MCI9369408.1 peptidoglycan glycosyltransferase [Lachnospiraceae bacterium]